VFRFSLGRLSLGVSLPPTTATQPISWSKRRRPRDGPGQVGPKRGPEVPLTALRICSPPVVLAPGNHPGPPPWDTPCPRSWGSQALTRVEAGPACKTLRVFSVSDSRPRCVKPNQENGWSRGAGGSRTDFLASALHARESRNTRPLSRCTIFGGNPIGPLLGPERKKAHRLYLSEESARAETPTTRITPMDLLLKSGRGGSFTCSPVPPCCRDRRVLQPDP